MLIFAADLPPSAASIHHQQWQTPQSRWICPWQRSLQRAADIHMVRLRTFHSISLSSCVFTNILNWVYTTTTAPCWGSIWCECWIWHWSRSDCVCAFQDGCYSEGADQPGERSLSRGQEKGDPLQLCHCLPRPQRESVQVGITQQQHWLDACSWPLANWSGEFVWTKYWNMCLSPPFRLKDIGNTVSGRKGTDDSMTLQSQRFQIGDYLDIAITPPNRAPPLNTRMRPFWTCTHTNMRT